ncbi:hypothetical protein G7046_g8158 [Stylonectria norvegica]|nr:hypothetical protein G7046_g8158 [Stylonectria norvegica]
MNYNGINFWDVDRERRYSPASPLTYAKDDISAYNSDFSSNIIAVSLFLIALLPALSLIMTASWDIKAEKCRTILRNSLNPAWLLSPEELPPAAQLNVSTFIDTCNRLSPRELEITNSDATRLTSQMQAGSLTAVETVTAFLKRAHIAQQLVNFATEFMVEDALKAAAELDEYFVATGKLKGPLHGIPVSLKEHVGLKDRITHAGYIAWIDNVPSEDAHIVRLLRAAGAVFHVRTNEPQTVMHLDCSNNIYGTTLNPHNRGLTAGGSSGGEGASLGLRCAVLGVGTDIGGSVRCPAAFCGVYGLRTTALRNPFKGIQAAGAGQESIRPIVSPLANSAADLNLFQKVLLDQEPWEEETSLVPMPWRDIAPLTAEKLTIGVIWDDGVVHPHPPVTRALKHAVSQLQKAGAKVVDFEPHDHEDGWDIISTLYFPDGASTQRGLLEEAGEPIAPLTEWIFGEGKPEPLSIAEIWKLNIRRDAYRDAYHRLMRERGVDFILCPAYVGAGAVLATCQYWLYTAVWNILDQPCIAFPTGLTVDPAIDVVEKDYLPRSAKDRREYEAYVPETFVGAPIALQLVGKHFRDEETVAATELVSRIVQGGKLLVDSRTRRVKCGEERPCCRNCSHTGHDCAWPTTRDLSDRRNLSRAGQQKRSKSPSPSSDSGALVPLRPLAVSVTRQCHAEREEPWIDLGFSKCLDWAGIQCDNDVELIYHFLNSFISVLVLPTWNRKHLLEYQTELVGMMMHSQGVKCAVLAACAANMQILTNNDRYEKLALVYYSRAVWHANQELHQLCLPSQVPTDSLMTTVVYLYLHDIWGSDPAVDPRRHVTGAIELLNMKYDHAPYKPSLRRTFDQFTAESILYQAFLLAIRRPFAAKSNFYIDSQFLGRIQEVLDSQINTLPSSSDISPILGATQLLYRFILDIINLHTAREEHGVDDAARLKAEMRQWEAKVLNEHTQDGPALAEKSFHANTLSLYILAASLLLDWITESPSSNTPIESVGLLNGAAPTTSNERQHFDETHRWQVAYALSILRQPGACETWSRCYLGTWPMLILGYAVSTDVDIKLIRHVLSFTRHRMGYGENQRILSELEEVWSARASARSPADDPLG